VTAADADRRGGAPEATLPVSVVVPARDEERGIAAAVASLLAQTPPVAEVIVVDDGSTDRTAEEAARAGDGDGRLHVIPAGPLPDGWVGKSWACWVGAGRAREEWLLFADADVVHAPRAVAAALATAEAGGWAGVTLIPRIVARTRAERWVLPAAVVSIGTFVAPGPLARRPGSPVAVAAGAFILIRAHVYRAVGGHRAMRGEMIDDIGLAARVKRAGMLLLPADGTTLVHLRMYHGAADLWRGWRKNASFAAPGHPAKGIVGAALVATAALQPARALLAGVRRRDPGLAAWGLAGTLAQCALQRAAATTVPTPRRDVATLPLGLLTLSAASVQSAVDRMAGRGAVWRGRRYRERP